MNSFTKLIILFLVASKPVIGNICDQNFIPNEIPSFESSITCKPKSPSLQCYMAPEIYHVHRERSGGAKQDGFVYGVRAGCDKVKRGKIYYGFDAFYGSGPLTGKGGSGNNLKSNFTDTSIEGRLGYTLKYRLPYKLLLTPFVGIGDFIEKNNFTHPKTTPIHFRTSYIYGSAGFFSRICIKERFFMGLNFKVKFPYEATCKVSNDPKNDNSSQVINEKLQYKVEVPLTYQVYQNSDRWLISLVPFYEYRAYGYHPNYPCDYLDTSLNIYGIQFKFIYCL